MPLTRASGYDRCRQRQKSILEIPMEAPQPSHLLTPRQLARKIEVSTGHIYRLIAQRRVPFVRVGGSVRFRPESIEAWIERNEVRAVSQVLHERNSK
jgi:excisionase family DNA binding protein